MPRVAVGFALAACVAAGCGWSDEDAGRSHISDKGSRAHKTTKSSESVEAHSAEAGPAEISPSPAVEVSEADFDRVVLMSGKPVLVDFRAAWCDNCKRLEPTVDSLARDFDGRVMVVKVDYDRSPALRERYQVRMIPAVLIFVDGRVVQESHGVKPKDELAGMLTSQLSAPAPERTALVPPSPPPAPPPMPTADVGRPLTAPAAPK